MKKLYLALALTCLFAPHSMKGLTGPELLLILTGGSACAVVFSAGEDVTGRDVALLCGGAGVAAVALKLGQLWGASTVQHKNQTSGRDAETLLRKEISMAFALQNDESRKLIVANLGKAESYPDLMTCFQDPATVLHEQRG